MKLRIIIFACWTLVIAALRLAELLPKKTILAKLEELDRAPLAA